MISIGIRDRTLVFDFTSLERSYKLLITIFIHSLVKMANNIKTAPKFNGLNFPIWKVRMNIFLQSLVSRVAKSFTKPYSEPVGEEDTWSDLTSKEVDANSKAQNVLLLALNEDDLIRDIHCKSAYEIWQHLLVTHERTSQVKRANRSLAFPI